MFDKFKAFYSAHVHQIRAVVAFFVVYVVDVAASGDVAAVFAWDKRRWIMALGAAFVAIMRAGAFPPPAPKLSVVPPPAPSEPASTPPAV